MTERRSLEHPATIPSRTRSVPACELRNTPSLHPLYGRRPNQFEQDALDAVARRKAGA